MKDLVELIIIFGFLFIIMCFAVLVPYFQCSSKWSSFDTRYGMIKGCQIELDGKWIPADSYYYKEGK